MSNFRIETYSYWPKIIPGGPSGPFASGNSTLMFGAKDIGAVSGTLRFLVPGFNHLHIAPFQEIAMVCPRAGTLQNFFVRHNVARGNGNPVVYTVLKNGVATAMTVSLATGVAGTGVYNATTIPIAQGDRISIQLSITTAIGSPASTQGCVDTVATIEFA